MRLCIVVILCTGALTGCAARSEPSASQPIPTADGILPGGFGPAVDRDVARARAATAAFRDLDRAVAAGYPGGKPPCLENPPHGGMGFHHQKATLLDDRLEVERPEILVYGETPDGKYQLNGVEYVVPFSAWRGAEPPTILGQALKPARSLGIWYLHVWIWERNANGLFADWNPAVKCPARAP